MFGYLDSVINVIEKNFIANKKSVPGFAPSEGALVQTVFVKEIIKYPEIPTLPTGAAQLPPPSSPTVESQLLTTGEQVTSIARRPEDLPPYEPEPTTAVPVDVGKPLDIVQKAGMPLIGWVALAGIGLFLFSGLGKDDKVKRHRKINRRKK